MSAHTKIEWADHTFNPWVGCAKVSPGCDHCYAEAWAKRFDVAKWGAGAPRHRTSASTWRQPLKWNAQAAASQAAWEKFASDQRLSDDELRAKGFFRPRRPRVFCASLADVFDNEVSAEWRRELFRLISCTKNLTWMLLTKRIGNAAEMLHATARSFGFDWAADPWEHVWLGATVVNQEEADRDIPKLLKTPAAKRFLSIEPMLGPVDLRALRVRDRLRLDALTGCHSGSAGPGTIEECLASLPRLPGSLPPVDWVIVGGESGPHARPMHPEWARSLRDQCTSAGVPFFMKQMTKKAPIPDDLLIREIPDA